MVGSLKQRLEFSWVASCRLVSPRVSLESREGSAYSTHLTHMQFFFIQTETVYE
jgi:hypothetical protein